MSLAIFKVVGIIAFLYLFWRNLREDYKEEELISYGWMALLSFFVGGRIVYGLINWGVWNDNWLDWLLIWSKPGMSYIGGYLVLLGVTLAISKYKGWKIWSFAEDGVNSFMVFIGLLMFDEFLRGRFNLRAGIYLILTISIMFIVNLVRKKYRSFIWYKSGKKGFVFLFANALWWLSLGLLSIWFKDGLIQTVSYLILCLISVVGLCILGEVFEPLLINIKRRKA